MIERVFVLRSCGGSGIYVKRRLRDLQILRVLRVLRNFHFLAQRTIMIERVVGTTSTWNDVYVERHLRGPRVLRNLQFLVQ